MTSVTQLRVWLSVVVVGGVVAAVAIAIVTRRRNLAVPPEAVAPAATAPPASAPLPDPSVQRLAGRWLRPDGGYVLELRAPQLGGKLEAAYLNPRPIHVGRAAWWEKNGLPAVFVELQDTGYPGATYELVYDAGRDRLVGTYTQPAAQQTFDVEFTRLGPASMP